MPPKKDEFLSEVEALKKQVEDLQAENEALKKSAPQKPVAKEGHKIIFVSSKFATTTTSHGGSDGKQVKKVVTGSVNSVPFEVECDKQVEVPEEVAGALKGLLDAQAAG